MEEYVGAKWHHFITRAADTDHENVRVCLDDCSTSLGILFRALGGDPALRLEVATPRDYHRRRHWLQKIAGSHKQAVLAWRDEETLRLPASIAWFATAALNRDVYLWLTALAAQQEQPFENWLWENQQLVCKTIERFPGLKPVYARLVDAHLQQRFPPEQLPAAEAPQELALRNALLNPGSVRELPASPFAPFPVYLWLYPLEASVTEGLSAPLAAPSDDDEAKGKSRQTEQKLRKRAKRTDNAGDKDGLMLFRLESLFSWSEWVNVDRSPDDTEDDNAEQVARDLDVITLSRNPLSTASRLKFDLDLPAAENDDLPLGGPILLPEWDYRRRQYRENYCAVQPMLSRDANPAGVPSHLKPLVQRLRRQFESLKPLKHWNYRQPEGDELDINAWLDFHCERQLGHVAADARWYRRFDGNVRSLSCLVLADLSLSTDSWINNDSRVIDVIQDSLLLLAEALAATGDRFSLYGFSSRKRDHVRFQMLKNFNESYGDPVRGRIQAIKPGYYTRMGAALRQATQVLAQERSHQRLLLVLTDGKPNDLDMYEGRYGVEDTRVALQEARRLGLRPFCVTIDAEAEDYLPYLFGTNAYVVIKDPRQLPRELPRLYAQLVQ